MESVTLFEISVLVHWTCQNDDVWPKVDVHHHFGRNLGYLNILPFLMYLIWVHWNIGRKLHHLIPKKKKKEKKKPHPLKSIGSFGKNFFTS